MPELPEVTTIVNQLQEEIIGSKIADVRSVGGYKTQPEFPEFRQKLEGREIRGVRRIAKNIVIEISNFKFQISNYIVIHLAMTGRLLLRNSGHKSDPWLRLVFKLKFPESESRITNHELRFCDSRMFGFVRLMSQDELERYAAKYGPDALDENLTPTSFLNQLKKKKTEVKRAMLEQDLIAGVGNIYANDSLWMCGIHPQTPTGGLTGEQAAKLLSSLRELLVESIKHRGSTLEDKMYIDIYGEAGEHQNFFRVFGKTGQPCPRCGVKIEFLEIGGRGTFFCPECQKKPVAGAVWVVDDDHKVPQQTNLL